MICGCSFLKKSLAEERYRINSSSRDDKYSTLGSSEGLIKDRINSVCFSRDGKCLATGSSDGGIYVSPFSSNVWPPTPLLFQVWEISTKFVRNAFKRDSGSIHSLDLSPNGRFLVSAYDNSIRLWNMRDGAGKFLTEDNPTFIDDPCYSSTVFCPDGRYVAASHRDGVVRVWDVRTGQLMRRVKAHMCRAYGVVFMPDREGLLSAGKDMTLKYWDIGTLYISRSGGSSQTTNSVDGCVSAVEEQTRSKRKFSGHKVQSPFVCFHPAHSYFLCSFHRIPSALLPSRLTADGLHLARMITASVYGTLALRRRNVPSTMSTK